MSFLYISATIPEYMPRVQVGSVSTHYEKIGSGPVLVFLHGWGQTWECWQPLIAPLVNEYTLVLPDLPGFGTSRVSIEKGWSTANYADWLQLFLQQEFGNQSCFVIGHSYGGKILLEYLCTHRSPQFSQAILIAPSGIAPKSTIKKTLLRSATKLMPRFIKQSLPDKLKKNFYVNVVQETDYLHATPFQAATLRRILPEDFTPELVQIQTPVTLIGGTKDDAVPPYMMEVLHNGIKNNTLHMLETGHFPFVEKTTQCVKIIQKALHA